MRRRNLFIMAALCVKEELEILKKAGEFGGKLCSKVTMEIIKDKLKID